MQRRRTVLRILGFLGVLGSLSAIAVLCAAFLYLSPMLPSVDVLREAKLQVPLRIYSQNGELMGEFGEKLRTPLAMEQVPQGFVDALLSAEDDRFLEHQGVDIGGLLRAAWQLVTTGEIQTGGSTITMQVARNFFLSREKTFLRKFNEILLALQIERELSKQEILELYVNKIYLGKRAYGIGAAANIYYGKSIEELDVAQLAMIAGLPKAPSAFNPINNPSRARVRRDWILRRMHKLGYLDEAQWEEATNAPVTAAYHGPVLELSAAYPAEMARAFAIQQFGLQAYTEGYVVTTTVDGRLQRAAQAALAKGLYAYDQRHGYRGPEQRLAPDEISKWLEALQQIPVIDQQVPAVVVQVGDDGQAADEAATEPTAADAATPAADSSVTLLLPNGEMHPLAWDRDANPLPPFINEDYRKPNPTSLKALFSPGDVIRLRENDDGSWRISQVPQASAAIIALKPSDGAIAAVVGGLDFKQSKFNRAIQARRQPGSNFKPFIYAAALDSGFTAAHVINDAPIVFSDSKLESDWRPENSGGKFYGPTTLRRALYLSRNLVSVRLLREVGIDTAINYLDRFAFESAPLPRDLSVSLGSHAMSPREVAAGYASFANGGYRIEPYLVETIATQDGEIIYRARPHRVCEDCETMATNGADTVSEDGLALSQSLEDDTFDEAPTLDALLAEENEAPSFIPAERILDPRVAYIVDDILQDVIKRGTGISARSLGRQDLAGKTGTTNGPTDAWFSGYHPELVVSTWLGFDDNQLLGKREYGGSAALPIWTEFMREALADMPTAQRPRPEGIVSVKIDPLTGEPTTGYSASSAFELFRSEYAPQLDHTDNSRRRQHDVELEEELF